MSIEGGRANERSQLQRTGPRISGLFLAFSWGFYVEARWSRAFGFFWRHLDRLQKAAGGPRGVLGPWRVRVGKLPPNSGEHPNCYTCHWYNASSAKVEKTFRSKKN